MFYWKSSVNRKEIKKYNRKPLCVSAKPQLTFEKSDKNFEFTYENLKWKIDFITIF